MQIPRDKLLHFGAGFVISALLTLASTPIVAICATALIGVGKEVYDAQGHGTPEVFDAVATIVGGVVGAIIMGVL